jgi:type IV pilus biogenesis protein CpaD/CtpE
LVVTIIVAKRAGVVSEDMADAIRKAMSGLGVELTNVPATEIDEVLQEARAAGQLSSHVVELLPSDAKDRAIDDQEDPNNPL